MTKLKSNERYWAELEVLPNKMLRIKRAQKYIKVNQYKTYWANTSSRDLARGINGKLVTR